jgi:hypothetical protein
MAALDVIFQTSLVQKGSLALWAVERLLTMGVLFVSLESVESSEALVTVRALMH